MPAYTTVVTHVTGDVLPATDWNTDLRDNLAFLHDRGADLASAATVTPTNQSHRVTGTTTITTIAAPAGTGQGGNTLLLKFQSAGCAITAGAAIVLTNGPFVSVANGVIEFWWDDQAAAWTEIGRVNFDTPGREWDYAQITAPVNIASTSEGSPTAVVTGNSVTYDGTRLRVEFFTPLLSPNNSAGAFVDLVCDSTVVGRAEASEGSGSPQFPGYVVAFHTPAAGAHTYKAVAYMGGSGTTGSVGAGAGGSGALLPAFLRVTKA